MNMMDGNMNKGINAYATAEDLPSTEVVSQTLKRELFLHEYRITIWNTLISMLVIVSVALLSTALFLPILRVYGKSMEGTLDSGDIVVTAKSSEYERGDIIAFYYNNNILVKRIIAIQGNQVKIDDEGDVYVNNAKIDEPYLRQKTKGDTDIEFPYTVPNGKLFVMGDNRALSLDSRNFSIGCIAEEQIVGKIVFRVWPLIKIGAVH